MATAGWIRRRSGPTGCRPAMEFARRAMESSWRVHRTSCSLRIATATDLAEIQEKLFTGFAVGALERGINCPQWGLDDWIYVGRGHGGGTITGPHLAGSVRNPRYRFSHQGRWFGDRTGRRAARRRWDLVRPSAVIGWSATPIGRRFRLRHCHGAYLAQCRHRRAEPGTRRRAPTRAPIRPASRIPGAASAPSDPGFAKFYPTGRRLGNKSERLISRRPVRRLSIKTVRCPNSAGSF